MKTNNRISHETRKRLDSQLQEWPSPYTASYTASRPREGWIKSVRTALGMSSRELGRRLGKTNTEILAIEKREAQNKVTLETLQKVAEAMGCRLLYAFIPMADSLESMVTANATKAASRIVNKTRQSMQLEDQDVNDEVSKNQVEDLAHELKQKLDPRIWRAE